MELDNYIGAIREVVKSGDIENAVLLTAAFVRKADEFQIALDLPDLLSDMRSESASSAAKAKRKLKHADAVRLVNEKLANNPRMSKSEAFRRVAEEQELEKGRDSWSAVRYAYTNPD